MKGYLTQVVCFALLLGLLAPPARAALLTVCADCALSCVADGVARARAGDTVLVKPGVYREQQIAIQTPLTLLGEGMPVLDGDGGDEILIVFADDVVIKGFELRNVGISFMKDRAAIRLVRNQRSLVADNVLVNTFFGIYLQQVRACTLRNNRILGESVNENRAGNAIHVWQAKHILIQDNYTTRHRDGIYFEFVDSSDIVGNVNEFNLRYGLHFMFSNNDLYQNNTFHHNGVGVAVMFSKHIRMIGNAFTDSWGSAAYGLLLKEISDGEIANNRFNGNTKGIYAEGSNRLHIHRNDFTGNGWALDIQGNCQDNRLEDNNFIANTFEVTTNSRQNNNVYRGNYWSKYSGYDLDRDGYGDIPHRPVSLFSMLTDRIPAAALLLHSLLINLVDLVERAVPSLTPLAVADERPRMNPLTDDTN